VIMSNHFHLALKITELNLSHGMKWLQGTWARRNNLYRRKVGRPFQGRYKAILLEPDVLNTLCSYLHLNPFRAGLETGDKIGSYRFSSLWWLPGIGSRPLNLSPEESLVSLGGLKDRASAWKKYVLYLKALSKDEPAQRKLAFDELSKGWCKGSKAFKKDLIKDLEQKGADLDNPELLGIEARESAEFKAVVWEKQLLRFSKLAKLSLKNWSSKKSDPHKVKLATLMKRKTSVNNRWLAERLEMGKPASVSQYVGRFQQTPGKELDKLNALLSRIES